MAVEVSLLTKNDIIDLLRTKFSDVFGKIIQ